AATFVSLYGPAMRFGVTLPPFNEWADPRMIMAMAAEAEAAGWDGFFLWDHISWNPAWGGTPAIADPWICLAAAATTTTTIRLGTLVTPLARRRPQKVAREIVSLDHLSRGRAVLGVGLGEPFEFEAFGQLASRRGQHLDEALAVLTGLLSGRPVDFEGEHLSVHSPPALPGPVNGTIPIWMGGWWPNTAPFLRAARYDGVVPGKLGAERGEVLTMEDFAAIKTLIGREDQGYEYVASGTTTSPADNLAVRRWHAAGATWWLETLHPFTNSDSMHERLRAGPPRLH
ncbi:MAG TPA: LLM class flavin-dependent oxidoreductase, partial [Propionibacteriaceae bacterium]|nr:LLM class flavin-dependent oxidoreductase [Propionibacteriaceae bacterium]